MKKGTKIRQALQTTNVELEISMQAKKCNVQTIILHNTLISISSTPFKKPQPHKAIFHSN